MKGILTTIILLSFFSAFAQQKNLSVDVKEVPLAEVILSLESKYNYLFSYKEEDVQGIIVSLDTKQNDIKSLMSLLLKDKGLQFEIAGDNYIILSKTDITEEELSNLESAKNLPLLRGRIIDSLTNQPLSYASVYLEGSTKGDYTSEDGYFELRTEIGKKDKLVFSYVGYAKKSFPAADFLGDSPISIQLNHLKFGENFIVVTDYLTDGIDLSDNGASTILRPERMGTLPGQAEPSVLEAIQFLPGISSPEGEVSSIHIRGGTPDQNLILWEDIPIYHTAHYFGMLSAFNPYIIDKIKVYRGGFGAEYGGRISGIIDLKSHDYRTNKSAYGAGLNFINGSADGKINLGMDKATIVYSLRRSLTELWESPTFVNITERNQQGILLGIFNMGDKLPKLDINDEFYFLDGHLKTSVRLSDKDEFSIAGFYTNNDFNDLIIDSKKGQNQVDRLDLISYGASASFQRRWSDRFSSKLVGVLTCFDYNYDYELEDTEKNVFERIGVKQNTIDEYHVHFSNHYKTNDGYELKLGYHFVNYDIMYRITQESRESPRADENENVEAALHAAYVGFNSPTNRRFGLEGGLRMSHYQKTGKLYLEPRLRLWFNAMDGLSFHANVGHYNQFLSQLTEFKGDDASGIDTPVWVLVGDREVPVLSSTQYQLGALFSKRSWVIDVQSYYKKINGLTSLSIGFDLPPQGYELGQASVKGLDILIKKRWKKYRTWISYSLCKVDYEFDSFFDQNFPAPHDQRHVFNWVNTFTLGNFECSLGWKISSGNPYSIMEGFEHESNQGGPGPMGPDRYLPIYNEYNGGALPLQHQLDASLLYRFQSNAKWKAVVGVSLLNIYQQDNFYNREYFISTPRNDPPSIDSVDKASLTFTPNAVVRFEW